MQQGATEWQQKVATDLRGGVLHRRRWETRGKGKWVILKTHNRGSLSHLSSSFVNCVTTEGAALCRCTRASKARCMDGSVDEGCKTRGTGDGEQEGANRSGPSRGALSLPLLNTQDLPQSCPLLLCSGGQGFTDQSRPPPGSQVSEFAEQVLRRSGQKH